MSWTLVGQDAAVAVLKSAVARDRVAHAYLFAGPKHVGKTVAALQFAQLLNCTGAEPPCGRCRACERIAGGQHPDVEMIGIGGLCDENDHRHNPDDSRDIRICQVRRMQHLVSRGPYEARYRVIIFEPADALGREATASLLKTLEEPPPFVVRTFKSGPPNTVGRAVANRPTALGLATATPVNVTPLMTGLLALPKL